MSVYARTSPSPSELLHLVIRTPSGNIQDVRGTVRGVKGDLRIVECWLDAQVLESMAKSTCAAIVWEDGSPTDIYPASIVDVFSILKDRAEITVRIISNELVEARRIIGIDCELPVRFRITGFRDEHVDDLPVGWGEGVLTRIGVDYARMRSDLRLLSGLVLDVDFELPRGFSISTPSRVVWNRAVDGAFEHHMELHNLTPYERSRIEHLLLENLLTRV